ncbi:MAG: LapA family protein [Sterolibacterium sp.]|jgi:uncharacterized integral membrane protein|nr:LapA family protein [Sterolibacterium sp.]
MRFLVWLLRIVVFVALFGLAIKNSGLVELRFYFGNLWQSPLSLVILGGFVAGVVLGVTAGFTTLIRLRRENNRLKEQLRAQSLTLNSPQARRAVAPVSGRAEAEAEIVTPPLNLI